jgi:acetyl esterase
MAVDPNFRTLLDMPEMQLGRPPEGVTAPMMREGMKAAAIKLVVPELFRIDELVIAGPGGPLALRVYYPSAQAGLPVTLFYHGGGWVLCDLDSHDHLARSLALASGSVVVSVDYRLAPDTRFPGPVEDCYAALQYVVNSAAALGVDASRVAVAGDSAGGNLAIAVALMARDRGGPALCHQALFYPVTKSGCKTGSFTELSSGYFLSREIMLWFWECYLASPEDASHPLASPMHAASFAGLPSASIATCEFDPLRDEGEQFGAALRAAGVQAATRRYAGMIHGFATMPHVTPVAEEAIRDLGHGLANAFRQTAASTANGASSMSTTTQEEMQMATAQRLYGAALTGDWAAVTEILTPDCLIVEAEALPFAGTYRGPQGMADLFVKFGSVLTIKDLKMAPMMCAGDTVTVRIELVVDNQGMDETLKVVELLRFENGRVAELTPFYFDAAQVHRCARKA